jgi:uncharacterized damage-inducible protein DinB
MNPEQAHAFLGFFLQNMEMEHPATRKVIAAVPDATKSYKPDDKAKNGHELAWHLATAEVWFMDGIINGGFDMESNPALPATIGEIVTWYDTNYKDRVAKLKTLSGEKLAAPIPFFGMTPMPAVMYLSFLTHHSAHHRGQLSCYLRPMGSKVPSIYGGSADEPFQMPANA